MTKGTIEIVTRLSFKKGLFAVVLTTAALLTAIPTFGNSRQMGLNAVLNTEITDEIIAELNNYVKVLDTLDEINAVHLRGKEDDIPVIESLPFVEAVSPDTERYGRPVDTVDVEDFSDGLSTWNLDAVNVTNIGFDNRDVDQDGTGVYVAVLDTGLLDSWRQYFPEERIATEYAICFGGGGMERGAVSTQPNKWEHDQDSHGTHVTSTILGYSLRGMPINGVAPMATVIPVKVLNQSGWCWSSVAARGIMYVAELKEGPLADYPVVINMSMGGPLQDPVEKAAIDYAISKGVIIVASAGNLGTDGMGYPGAYAPVISVAASGWVYEWFAPDWWFALDVAEPTNPTDFYITDFSSRAQSGQDLDVTAPGSWVVGPYQLQSGWISYYYLGGTSMASPHVAGIVALMAEKKPDLIANEAELILESTAIPMPSYTAAEAGSGMVDAQAALSATP
jgi:subtilisin family serine protease